MIKRLCTLFLCIFAYVAVFSVPVYAESDESTASVAYDQSLNRVVDESDLLTNEEEQELEAKINEIITDYQFDCVIVTVDSYTIGDHLNYYTQGSIMEFADDFYDYSGYGIGSGYDGIIFVVSMSQREWWFSTCGYGMEAINETYGLKWLEEEVIDDLSDGNYYECFDKYVDSVRMFVSEARTNKPYDGIHRVWDVGHLFDAIKGKLFIAIFFAAIVTSVVTSILKARMKTVKQNLSARNYMKPGSFKLNSSQDVFLYSRTSRNARSSGSGGSGRSRSGHRSSSGRSHGGRGGRF